MNDNQNTVGFKLFPGWNFIYPTQQNSIIPTGITIDSVFQPHELELIIEYCSKLPLVDGVIGGGTTVDLQIRKSKIAFFDVDKENEWWTTRINHCMSTVNDQVFKFDLVGFVGLQYTEYTEDSCQYDWHLDTKIGIEDEELKSNQFNPHMRKLSLSFILSDPSEYEGGELDIDPGTINSPPQRKGDIIFFPSFLRHRVRPVTRGKRKSIVVWAVGPKFR
jgi:PKHD-type hydroxylase